MNTNFFTNRIAQVPTVETRIATHVYFGSQVGKFNTVCALITTREYATSTVLKKFREAGVSNITVSHETSVEIATSIADGIFVCPLKKHYYGETVLINGSEGKGGTAEIQDYAFSFKHGAWVYYIGQATQFARTEAMIASYNQQAETVATRPATQEELEAVGFASQADADRHAAMLQQGKDEAAATIAANPQVFTAATEQASALVRVVVVNENTLGYIYPDSPERLSILAASIIKNSRFRALDGPGWLSDTDTIRPATIQDFDAYRVQWEGYRKPCLYGYTYDLVLPA